MANEKRTSLYLPTEVEQAMKQLAGEHDRSLNGEITQACRAWVERYKATNEQERNAAWETWGKLQLQSALQDMQAKDMEVNPDTFSAYFRKEYELPLNATEAAQFLNKQK